MFFTMLKFVMVLGFILFQATFLKHISTISFFFGGGGGVFVYKSPHSITTRCEELSEIGQLSCASVSTNMI